MHRLTAVTTIFLKERRPRRGGETVDVNGGLVALIVRFK
jgi:hypothetical protein